MDLSFYLNPFIEHHMSGHFIAPSPSWRHMSRPLQEYELVVVTEGTLYIADGSEHFTIQKGEYRILSPTCRQFGWKPSQCSFYWLHFRDSTPENCQKIITLPNTGKLPFFNRFSILFSQFYDLTQDCRDDYIIALSATGLLLEIYRQVCTDDQTARSTGYSLYKKILEYTEWNSGYRLSVADIARYLGYHPKYISHVFHRFHDCTLKHYLLQQTMEHAKNELAYSRKSISEIAESMGFLNVHNFSTSFRHIVGVSPRQYRESFSPIPPNHY